MAIEGVPEEMLAVQVTEVGVACSLFRYLLIHNCI